MYDIGLNLFDKQFKNPELIYNNALKNNIYCILTGTSIRNIEKIDGFVSTHDDCWATAGIHPHNADSYSEATTAKLREFVLKNNKFVAIGECGLDYHWTKENIEYQHKLFRMQCELAIKMNLPVIVHSRDADQDTFDIIKSYKGKLKGVMHCYSGSYELAKEYIKLGFYISLGGPVTFKNAKEPKRIAENIDLSRLLIETDCPYLAPTPFRGQRNESSYVKYVCDMIASIRGVEPSYIEKITEENAIKLFNI